MLVFLLVALACSQSVGESETQPESNNLILKPICFGPDDCLVYNDTNPTNCQRGITSISGRTRLCFKPCDFDNWFCIVNDTIRAFPGNNVFVVNVLFLNEFVGTQFNVSSRYVPERHCFYIGYEDNTLERLCTDKHTLINRYCFGYANPLPKRYCVYQTYNGKTIKFVGQSPF